MIDQMTATADDLSIDVLANIFRYVGGPKAIMKLRRVCGKWGHAVRQTIVPPIWFCVHTTEKYNVMKVMATMMPNLQLIALSGLNWSDGEDPDESMRPPKYLTTSGHMHDVDIISKFSKLRILEIKSDANLNGRYPVFFKFPQLQILRIGQSNVKWDLEMLAGLPILKELKCCYNDCVRGDVNSLRMLKDTLEKVDLYDCENIEGNFMNLANFPHLKMLNLDNTAVSGDIGDIGKNDFASLLLLSLYGCKKIEGNFMSLANLPRLERLDLDETPVRGDIRDVGENDFVSLKHLILPKAVYGGNGYELQRISEGPEIIRTLHLFEKQRPELLNITHWCGQLSEDSPDWYETGEYEAPFQIRFVEAGPRLGYQWGVSDYDGDSPCEVNWLDPEPDRESGDYKKYVKELTWIENKIEIYRGFHQPPTEEEYNRL